jgi:hypothetical protein
MDRYFFHLRDGATIDSDEDGKELPNLEAARAHAIQCARELLSEAALSGKAGSLNQQIEVTDKSGRTVLIMPIGHATDVDSQA